ncbi:hypothetical protein BAU15_01375 [Enterococcus sp. JM4C]|uniref:DUF6442 family protein n=1 Tax=Candidatus Enterococcus huntleyi TaxID=1857217 RepID=UPI001379734E|nr:DUF6442 family protein [Enterococcus sp. JM4C]KAF1299324.1 hypothetical protein BAU15_01375 [Enterococcus sp. JM4C]
MNKEELLRKARDSKKGAREGVEHQQVLNGSRYGGIVFVVVAVLLMVYTLFKWRLTELYMILAIVWLYFPATVYGMTKIEHKKNKQTGTIIVCFIIGLALLGMYFIKSW